MRDDKPAIPYPSTWNLPGGGVEEGENYDQALMRELSEELSIIPGEYRRLGTETFSDSKATVRYIVWLSDEEVKRLKLGEGQKCNSFQLMKCCNFLFLLIPAILSGRTPII